MKILAIETSCDETAAAVVEDGTKILTNVIASSTQMHKKYGGVVPEIAAREQLKCIIPTIEEAISVFRPSINALIYQDIKKNIDAVAITVGPGLIGSLLVGVETAKTIAFVTGKPIIPVNHVLAHMYANFVNHQQTTNNHQQNISSRHSRVGGNPSLMNRKNGSPIVVEDDKEKKIEFPAISLVVSGGHTELYLMKSVKDLTWLGGTLDDAAGEAFDKTARLLGFGTGGGRSIEVAARKYTNSHNLPHNPSSPPLSLRGGRVGLMKKNSGGVTLPRPMLKDDSLNISFSGLKTAVLREWTKYAPDVISNEVRDPNGISLPPVRRDRNDIVNAFAFEIQEAITDVLVEKTLRAAKQYNAKSILLSGGVAANSRLREKFNSQPTTHNSQLFAPPPALCTDNAVYIASYAFFRGEPTDWHEITAQPDLNVEI